MSGVLSTHIRPSNAVNSSIADANESLVLEDFVGKVDVEAVFEEVEAGLHATVLSPVGNVLVEGHDAVLDAVLSLREDGVEVIDAVLDETLAEFWVGILEALHEATQDESVCQYYRKMEPRRFQRTLV